MDQKSLTEEPAHASFKDPTDLTNWTKWLIYSSVAVSAVGIVSSLFELQVMYNLSESGYATEEWGIEAAEPSDLRQFLVAVFDMIVNVLLGILVLQWIYRANQNAERILRDYKKTHSIPRRSPGE